MEHQGQKFVRIVSVDSGRRLARGAFVFGDSEYVYIDFKWRSDSMEDSTLQRGVILCGTIVYFGHGPELRGYQCVPPDVAERVNEVSAQSRTIS